MSEKIEELLKAEKISKLLKKNEAEEETKNCLLWVFAIIGAVVAVAGIAYAVYRCMTPKYLDDVDGDFDYDEFEDDFDDAVTVNPAPSVEE